MAVVRRGPEIAVRLEFAAMRVAGAFAAALACSLLASGARFGSDELSRSDVLAEFAREVAVPRFEALAESATNVVAAIDAVCADPGAENVAVALASVEDARRGWLSMQAMWTGPVMERRSPALIDWPVNVADIEALVDRSATGEITPDVVAKNVGADTRGLSAVRWVLSADDSLERLEDERWCDYLDSTKTVVASEADVLLADWTESWDDGPPFVEVLADERVQAEWLSMFVNDNVNLANKLGVAPDERRDDEVDTAADRVAQLEGLAEFAAALGPLLGDDLAGRLDAEIEAARAAYADGDIDAGRQLSGEVEATMATEVAARLGVTIGFSDSDGDSAG